MERMQPRRQRYCGILRTGRRRARSSRGWRWSLHAATQCRWSENAAQREQSSASSRAHPRSPRGPLRCTSHLHTPRSGWSRAPVRTIVAGILWKNAAQMPAMIARLTAMLGAGGWSSGGSSPHQCGRLSLGVSIQRLAPASSVASHSCPPAPWCWQTGKML